MAEPIVNPEAEAIAPVEGSVAAIETPIAPKEETVPLGTFLELKDELKDIKKQLKENAAPQSKAETNATIKDLATRYPDVNQDFIRDIVSAATLETEAKFKPQLERQENERQQATFDKKFDDIYNSALAENPDAKEVNKEAIKALALSPQYNNTPVTELIKMLYPVGTVGRATTENNMRVTGATIDAMVDIDRITPEQRTQIMDDPSLRKAYFDKLDMLGR